MFRSLWAYLLLGCIVVQPAAAEINAGYSPEWIAYAAQFVAVATPLTAEIIKGPGDVWFVKARFQIEEPLKGGFTRGDTMTVYDWSWEPDPLKLIDAARRKRRMLIFCSVSQNHHQEVDGKFCFTEQHSIKSAYYADEPVLALYTADFRRVPSFQDLLQRTRTQVRKDWELSNSNWRGTVEKKSLEVPPETEASKDLYSGSVCYVYIPEYTPK